MSKLEKPKQGSFKQGANKLDQNKIKSLSESGETAKEISTKLKICVDVVKSFMPKKKAAPKKKDNKEE